MSSSSTVVKALIVVGVLAVAGGAMGLLGRDDGTGGPASDFTLYSTRGRTVSLSDFAGKVVVVDFWATWCPPCRKALPALQRLHEEYESRGLVVLGVNVEDTNPAEFCQQQGLTYRTLTGGGEVAQQYGVRGIPTLLVVSADGTVVYRETGWGSGHESKLRKVIDEQLAAAGL